MTGTKVIRLAVVVSMAVGLAGLSYAGKPDNPAPKPKPDCTVVGLTYGVYLKCGLEATAKPMPGTIFLFQDGGVVLVNGVVKQYTATVKPVGKRCKVDFTITDWGQDANGNPETLVGRVTGNKLQNLSARS